MANTPVMNGARAVVKVNGNIIGLYENITWTISLNNEPIHILGRFSPAEIAVTSYEAVTCNCSGFRFVGNGAFTGSASEPTGTSPSAKGGPSFPALQDLLTLEDITLSVTDRQTGLNILTVIGCKATSYNSGFQSKAVSKIAVTYVGIRAQEENLDQNEVGANDLP
jgi:hypothetical protein